MLTHLLISVSALAATRLYDWLSNWGKDTFPAMASASVGFSFVAFLGFFFFFLSPSVLATNDTMLKRETKYKLFSA